MFDLGTVSQKPERKERVKWKLFSVSGEAGEAEASALFPG